MEEKKFMLISMDDDRAKALSEVLGNKSCKKIIDFLSTKNEASETDIAKGLSIPANTVNYNIKKLLDAGLIEKTTNFFWSRKGKKILMYTLSNKSIIIAPKNTSITSKIKSILPVALVGTVGAVLIKIFNSKPKVEYNQIDSAIYSGVYAVEERAMGASKFAYDSAVQSSQPVYDGANLLFSNPSNSWIWFLGGVCFCLILFAAWNWRKL